MLISADRWAQPILMPLTGKMDFAEPLQTPRPARALLSLCYLYPVRDGYACSPYRRGTQLTGGQVEAATSIVPEDGLVHEGKVYCFAGKATWQSLVQQGKVAVPRGIPSVASDTSVAAHGSRCRGPAAIGLLLAAEALPSLRHRQVRRTHIHMSTM